MKDGRLSGSVAVVTGAASGIGREIARVFAQETAAVVIADISPAGQEVADAITTMNGRAIHVAADVTRSTDVAMVLDAAEQAFGVVDILVNNAFFSRGDALLTSDERAWDETMSGVLKGAFLCSQACLPGMMRLGRGSIVNIASVNALRFVGHDAYSAAKAGLVSMTQAIAVRHGPDGVRANAIAPGTIRTPAWDKKLKEVPSLLSELKRRYPLGRVGEPADVAAAALFLASADAGWITGVVLPVDGGLLAGDGDLVRLIEGSTSA